ncbi:DUF1273 domain-containing protein [Streptococcus chenjunshii]|uniref:UPF0398 protein DDV21_009205 n=1 Tax=Streptococcus chenjunshii TaxID=2173853 RepID=A0A372KJC3_9STRE|nr:DUF1273 domain-containing protein [Streptococcus chenjunshii]AXQ79239.1 DUF1273 domain-containing protein [Streptococcus chenjunshii]RFU52369.1 DUF1273 domain-containing protein [Streptococcus chenjunshii]
MHTILITGYKSFELGIFQDKDKRIEIIKTAIRKDLQAYLEEGTEWFIFTGNLGFEFWALEVALELQKDYEFRIASVFLFQNQGENWNAANQEKLVKFKGADFLKYCYEQYQGPWQFRQYNQFLLDNSDGAYIFYDSEQKTNLHYLVEETQKRREYPVHFLTFDRLNELLED